jgi:hypothetical protein
MTLLYTMAFTDSIRAPAQLDVPSFEVSPIRAPAQLDIPSFDVSIRSVALEIDDIEPKPMRAPAFLERE